MTREEAIEVIKRRQKCPVCVEYHDCDACDRDYDKALDMAIASLEAEPCEDTISRKHLLSEIDELMRSPWFNSGKDDDMITHYGYVERKEAVEIVRDLCVKKEPPVTPKQRTGKWIYYTIGFHACSCCGSLWSTGITENVFCNYCPRCGAKMEREE